ncbi:MAG: serine/threonine protein kinase, partial [Acidobacteriia bacterium]|nr:serine/threonine protein kinase [Terriglobia bacterium]
MQTIALRLPGTPMPNDTWSRVEELFQAARAQPPEERAEFLSHACSGDSGLRSEVESLLLVADDSFLDGSPLSSVENVSPSLAPEQRLGHFEIIRLLAHGGMGDVYRARDIRLAREVALKVLPPAFSQDRSRLARFEQEARAASALNHPNIISLFDTGSSDGVFWIATELVEGETLSEVIGRGPVPVSRLIGIACQIAAGLAAAHGAGVIHRDLKPANLMLTRDGRVKILDFGLAKHIGRRNAAAHGNENGGQERSQLQTQSMTLPGLALGTPGYMSPEQVRGEPVDVRSDLFSLGAILYEMAAGRRAFPGDSSVAVMNAILKDEPLDLPLDANPLLARIVRRCLEKEP